MWVLINNFVLKKQTKRERTSKVRSSENKVFMVHGQLGWGSTYVWDPDNVTFGFAIKDETSSENAESL